MKERKIRRESLLFVWGGGGAGWGLSCEFVLAGPGCSTFAVGRCKVPQWDSVGLSGSREGLCPGPPAPGQIGPAASLCNGRQNEACASASCLGPAPGGADKAIIAALARGHSDTS